MLSNNETSVCKIFDKLYQTSLIDDGQEYRIGKFGQGLNGVLVTAQIWNYAKALTVPKDQCNSSTNAPKPFCLSCDYYLGDQTYFDSCNFTNIGGFPYQNSIYNCPNLCLTCKKTTQCTYCQDDSRMSTFDCVCKYGYYQLTNVTTGRPYCTGCDPACERCYNSSNNDCISCSSGLYKVDGTRTCVKSCLSVRNYYLDQITQSCKLCTNSTFTPNGLTCLSKTTISYLKTEENYKYLLKFSRPVTLNAPSIFDAFKVKIKGPRQSYRYDLSINNTRMTYFQALEFTFKPKSSFFNLETIKIDLRYSEAFLDKYRIGVEPFVMSQPSGYFQYLSQSEKEKNETPILISQIFLYALILIKYIRIGEM